MIKRFPNIRPGSQLSAAEFNRAMDEIERLTRLGVDPPIELRQDSNGLHLRLATRPGFWAQLTDKQFSGSGLNAAAGSGCSEADTIWYSFRQVIDDGCGDWTPLAGGIKDDLTLFEANNLDVPLTSENGPTVVRVYFAPASSKFVFQFGGTGVEGGSGSGGECNNMAADFSLRTPADAKSTDRLLTSDSVTDETINYALGDLLDAQLAVTSPAGERFWPGKFHANSLYGSITADAYAATMTFNMGVTGSNFHSVTLGGNPTLFVSGTAPGQIFGLYFKQDATAGRTIGAWFSGIIWEGAGTAPTLASAAGSVTRVLFQAGAAGATHRHIDTKTWAS